MEADYPIEMTADYLFFGLVVALLLYIVWQLTGGEEEETERPARRGGRRGLDHLGLDGGRSERGDPRVDGAPKPPRSAFELFAAHVGGVVADAKEEIGATKLVNCGDGNCGRAGDGENLIALNFWTNMDRQQTGGSDKQDMKV